jgi:antitoxin VapB
MALNIKNEETQKLAHELSKLTGESMTAAVTEAVRERLDRLRSAKDAGLAARILKIGKDCAAHLQEPYRSIDHGELLYDEKGMPR